MGLFGKKIAYGIKGIGVEAKKLKEPTKNFGLATKKIIENTSPRNSKLKPISDISRKRYSLSQNVYVRPKSFIDFENTRKKGVKMTDIF